MQSEMSANAARAAQEPTQCMGRQSPLRPATVTPMCRQCAVWSYGIDPLASLTPLAKNDCGQWSCVNFLAAAAPPALQVDRDAA